MAKRIWVVRAAEVIAGCMAKGSAETAIAPAAGEGGPAGPGAGATGRAPKLS